MNRKIESVINDIKKGNITKEKIIFLLSNNTNNDNNLLFSSAYQVKEKYVGKRVYIRGLIEFSNICKKNCYYCGIRKDNKNVRRYLMKKEEVIESVLFAYNSGFGSIVLQSGEREDSEFLSYLNDIIKEIRLKTDKDFGITLCVGEQERKAYESFFESGAKRYLLRIETSNKSLYEKIHPSDHSFDRRLSCIKTIKDIGFQTGTGVMIGLPFQTIEDLADDIIFFIEKDVDMIGMGPYIEHNEAPLSKIEPYFSLKERFELTLKMISILRLAMKDINIASTTALQAIRPDGREIGILAGANVIMPNITPLIYREDYKLYENKPCTSENSENCFNCILKRVESIGESIGLNLSGDPIHYMKRKSNEK